MVYFTSNRLLLDAISSMLIVYRKNNSNIAQFVGYLAYLAITKHIDFILKDFNKGPFNDVPINIFLQSLGYSQSVSEVAQIRGSCLDEIYIKNQQNKISFFEAKVGSGVFSDHDPVFLFYDA